MKIPELAGFEENPFVVVAKNHPTHAANTVCLMMSEPYKTGTFYNPGGRVPYYEISDLKTDAEALYNKMPQGLKSRIIKTKAKAQIVNGASDIEGYVLPPTASEIKGGDASGFVAEELKINKAQRAIFPADCAALHCLGDWLHSHLPDDAVAHRSTARATAYHRVFWFYHGGAVVAE